MPIDLQNTKLTITLTVAASALVTALVVGFLGEKYVTDWLDDRYTPKQTVLMSNMNLMKQVQEARIENLHLHNDTLTANQRATLETLEQAVEQNECTRNRMLGIPVDPVICPIYSSAP